MNAKQKDPRKPILNIIYIFLGLIVLMVGYFSFFLIVRRSDVINNSYNRRQEVLAQRVIRGEILSADGKVLAETLVDEKGQEYRKYPFDKVFAHIVGRSSKGITGIEETENIHLLTSNINSFEVMYSNLAGEKSQGDNVVTTLNAKLQQVAYDALGNYRGAVVVMEPSSGKLLAMVSKPSYDPNHIDEQWDRLVEDKEKESVLYNRATQELYPPGSTFKILTALEFMREHPDYIEYEYNCDGKIEYEEMTIHCYHNKIHGEVDLPLSFAKSCNTSFAGIGMTLDINSFYQLSEDFLFNKILPVTFPSNASRYTMKAGSSGVKEAMQTAIGQGHTLVTPLHNAMIAAAVANKGIMMKPYVVDYIENADGNMIKQYKEKEIAQPMTSYEAHYIGEMMRLVITDGTGTKLKNLSEEVAGKTGSADHGEGKAAHAWFIGYAPYDDPEIAISVVVEDAGAGSDYAVPIAKKVFDAYFDNE